MDTIQVSNEANEFKNIYPILKKNVNISGILKEKKTKKSNSSVSTHPSSSSIGKNEIMQPDAKQLEEGNEE